MREEGDDPVSLLNEVNVFKGDVFNLSKVADEGQQFAKVSRARRHFKFDLARGKGRHSVVKEFANLSEAVGILSPVADGKPSDHAKHRRLEHQT